MSKLLSTTIASLICFLTLTGPTAYAQNPNPSGHSAPIWLEVEIGIIGAASEDILNAAMEEVQENDYQGLLIKLDTPGGALENTRNMVKAMMDAPFPVVVWVGPAGSRAGSAGAFITLAAHVATMAPGTNIGAAAPVQASGKKVDDEEMARKIKNDTVAFIESIAMKRGRNIEMARSFVETSVSITSEEAFKNNIIDMEVSDLATLYFQLDGREIELASGSKKVISTAGVVREQYAKTFRQKALEILSNPNLFYLLFLAGMIGIGFELTHPGAMFPGVAGGICMILALIATSVIPVSFGAAALMLVGIALLIAEAFVPSFGVLGIGGVTAFVIGSIFLVDPSNEQGLRLSWTVIAPGSLAMAGAGLTVGFLILKAERAPIKSGREGMIGQIGKAISPFIDGEGQLRVSGAIWSAQLQDHDSYQPQAGDQLKIESVEGLVLTVTVVKPK